MKSVREIQKTRHFLTPLFVIGESVMECILPFLVAKLVNTCRREVT